MKMFRLKMRLFSTMLKTSWPKPHLKAIDVLCSIFSGDLLIFMILTVVELVVEKAT